MKLFIQIPCFNEEKTLPEVVRDLPRQIDGIDEIEVMIVDDGSSDKTIEVARRLGIRHIVEHGSNRGLAMAFRHGSGDNRAHDTNTAPTGKDPRASSCMMDGHAVSKTYAEYKNTKLPTGTPSTFGEANTSFSPCFFTGYNLEELGAAVE